MKHFLSLRYPYWHYVKSSSSTGETCTICIIGKGLSLVDIQGSEIRRIKAAAVAQQERSRKTLEELLQGDEHKYGDELKKTIRNLWWWNQMQFLQVVLGQQPRHLISSKLLAVLKFLSINEALPREYAPPRHGNKSAASSPSLYIPNMYMKGPGPGSLHFYINFSVAFTPAIRTCL